MQPALQDVRRGNGFFQEYTNAFEAQETLVRAMHGAREFG